MKAIDRTNAERQRRWREKLKREAAASWWWQHQNEQLRKQIAELKRLIQIEKEKR